MTGLFFVQAEASTEDEAEAFEKDFARHLGFTHTAVLKDDGRLDNFEIMLPHTVDEFYLEGIAL